MAAETPGDVESLLRSALRPIEPPENLPGRVEETLSAVSESELRSLRDPRNWVRPAAAIAAGGVAAGGLVLVELRRRGGKKPSRFSDLADQVSEIADQIRDQVRNRID